MGFWNFILGKKKEIIEDDFFGKLTVDNGYSESKQYFQPTNSFIDLLLALNNNKPNAEQKAFYQLIENKYDELIPILTKSIEEECIKGHYNLQINDLKKEFTLVGLDLSLCDLKPIDWNIYFDTIPNEKYYYFINISMNDFEVEDIIISY